jgi:DUF971 family protein
MPSGAFNSGKLIAMSALPQDLKALRTERLLRITWSPEHIGDYAFDMLRKNCNCAACVDENTGIRILDPRTIPADIAITDMQLVGNYALRIHWSDGHSSGLYTWDHLLALCACQKCRAYR